MWFRRVLLQDAAVLATSHPAAPAFQYPPFNSVAFRSFAASSAELIARAEENARLALERLPENYAHTFQGLVQGVTLEQQRAAMQNTAQINALTQTVESMKAFLEMERRSKRPRTQRQKSGKLFVCHVCLVEELTRRAVAVPPSMPVSPAPPESLPMTSTLPPPPLTASNYFPHTARSQPSPSPSTQTSAFTVNISSSPSGLVVSPQPPITLPLNDVMNQVNQPVCPPPPGPIRLAPPFVNDHVAHLQLEKWSELACTYTEPHLGKHMWEWRGEDWVPYYTYPEIASITVIWEEWTNGLDGFLSTRQLEERWGARWRRNLPNMKTAHSRRKKLIQLIQELSNKHRWNTKLALRFLKDKYEPLFSARKFCEYLQKKDGSGWQAVMDAANGYP
jgi:Transcriptional activator of glycolytic enzymes